MKIFRAFSIAALILYSFIFIGWQHPMKTTEDTSTEFFNATIDTVHYNLLPAPADAFLAQYSRNQTTIRAETSRGNSATFYLGFFGATPATYNLSLEIHAAISGGWIWTLHAPMNIVITEFGPAGTGYIAGTASGTLHDMHTETVTKSFTCSFRVKRDS